MSKKLTFQITNFFLLISFVVSCSNQQITNTNNLTIQSGNYTTAPDILKRLNEIFVTKPQLAIEIAGKKLNVLPENTESLTPCDGGLSWRIVDIKKMRELWAFKDDGKTYTDPISISRNVFQPVPDKKKIVNQEEAYEIAKLHFIEYGREKFNSDENIVQEYFPSVCDLNDYWRVYFLSYRLEKVKKASDIKNLGNDHPPDYLIDKKTGEIIYFSLQ